VSAAEDDEIVGLGDNMRVECFATSAEAPMLEKAVRVNDGEQRTDDSALRCAAFAAPTATPAPLAVAVPFLGRRLQP
jgi:hypothetical protein